MADQQQQGVAKEKKQGGFFGNNLFPKILILLAVGLLLSIFIFGIPNTIPDILWMIIKVIIGIGILVLAVKIMEAVFSEPQFSPTQRFREKVIRLAEMSKPRNVRELYLRGEDMRVYSFWGHIGGLLWIPYLSAKPILDDKGNYLYHQKLDKQGKPMTDNEGRPIMVHDLSQMTEKDGEWLFVINTSSIPFLSKKELVRAKLELCSDIGEKVWIKTPNLLPIGDYNYPAQQWQADIPRVQVQHQAEVMTETAYYFLDQLAEQTAKALTAEASFQKQIQLTTENVSTQQAPIQQLGR